MYLFRKANSAIDWMAAYMAYNIGTTLWDSAMDLLAQLLNILFYDSHDIFILINLSNLLEKIELTEAKNEGQCFVVYWMTILIGYCY